MRNSNLLKSILILFLLLSNYTFSNSIEYSCTNKKLVNTLLPASITTISPSLGHAGTVVTITDVGGSFIPASTVTLAGNPIPPANIVYVNANSLQVTIPCGATTGTFSVDSGLPSAQTFTYIPPSITTSLSNLAYCNGFTVPALPLSGTPLAPTTGTLMFTWTSSNPAIGLANSVLAGVQIPSFTAVNATSSPITSTITITPEINGCVGLPMSYDITVDPTPDVSPLGFPLTPICDGTIVSSVVLNSTVVGTTFTWSGDSNAAAIGFSPISGTGSPIPSFTAVNNTNATISSTFSVTPTFNGCVGPLQTYTISVLPASVGGNATATASTICSGGSTTITLSGNTGNIQWQTNASGSFVNIPSATSATYLTPALISTTSYQAIVTSGACISSTSTVAIVTVDTAPAITTQPTTPAATCAGSGTQTMSVVATGTSLTYSWRKGGTAVVNGGVISGQGTATLTLTNPLVADAGSYDVIVSGTCMPAVTSSAVMVAVNPLPIVMVNSPTICAGGTATITATPSPAGSYNYFWSSTTGIPDPGNVATFTTAIAGDYTVTITETAAPNCASLPATGTLTLNPLPTANITGTANVCQFNTTLPVITFTGLIGTPPFTFTYNINGAPYTITTTSGNSTTVSAPTGTAGVFNYDLLSVTDSSLPAACSQPITGQSAIITVLSQPNLIITDPADICQGDTTDLTVSAVTAGSDAGLTYSYWTNATATITYATPNAATAGTYYIKATNGIGCPTIKPVVVTAKALPTVTVNSSTICANGTATITAIPNPAGSYIYSWIVPAGVPNPGNSASVTTNIAGNYTVNITNTTLPACVSLPATGTVTVNPLPTAAITSSTSTVCIGSPATVTITGAIGTAPYTFTYNINGGPTQTAVSMGNSITIPVATSIVGVFNYNLISVTDSSSTTCSQLITGQTAIITVKDLPTVNAGLDITVCAGEPVTLIGTGTATTYAWNNGVVDNVAFIPTLSTTYTVTGTDGFGCVNTDQVAVTIIPEIEGTIKLPNDFEVCKDTTPQDVVFVGSGGTAPYTFTYEITSLLLASPITGTVTSIGNEAILVPQIPTTTAGSFTVTLLGVKDSGFCNKGNLIAPKEAFITVLGAGISPVNPIDVSQIVCENIPIVNIVFNINGSPTNAYVENLPGNVTSNYDISAGELTISGAPNEVGVFPYIVKTSGSLIGCNAEFYGTLTVNETGKLSVVSPSGSDLQSICINNAITTINYTIQGAATGATVVFTPNTPAGITWTVSGSTVTISGTPTETGIFNYTVETFSILNSCLQTTKTGTITINESNIIIVSGTPNQTACINNAIIPIDFDINSTPITLPAASLKLVGTLPTGVSFDSVTGIISGTPTQGGSFPYIILASTGCAVPIIGQIIVNSTLPTVLIEGGLPKIEACEGSVITLTATGASTYMWYIIDSLGNHVPIGTNADIYTYQPISNQTIYVTGKTASGCENTTQIDVLLKPSISATITGVNTIDVCKDSSNPLITFTGSNGTAPYIFTYTINSITNTVVSSGSDSAVISIPTNVTGQFDVKLIDVKDSSGSAYCSPSKLLEPTTAKVTVVESSILPQLGTPIYQTVCEGTPILDIKFNITGGATNAYVLGLPLGIVYSYGSGLLTISGTPTESGVFVYTVSTSGSPAGCNTSFTGTITVNANDSITLLSIGNDNQQICPSNSIVPILYELGGGATGATVVFTPNTPAGITWSISGKSLTISGASNDTPGNYNYTITTKGICTSTTATGVITIIKTNSLVLTSGNKNEVLCVNSSLTPIQYNGNLGQTLVLNGVLPPGTNFVTNPAAGSASIIGTPTLTGNYLYSITTDNSCGDKLDGSIVVEANAFINYVSGELNQVACIGTPIETLRYVVPLNVTSTMATITPSLPTGLSYVVVGGELIISGTPTSILIATTYDITVNNGCGTPAKSSFKLTIVDSPVIALETDSGALNQSVCQNGAIVPIKFKLSGAATGIDLSLLPAFITSSFNTTTGIYTLSGAPITTGTFKFEIKTIGVSSCSASLSVTIDNLYAAVSIVRTSAAGTDNQILCSFKPIIPIVYDVIGNITNPAIISVTGLPSGVTPTKTLTTTGVLVTISGTPTVSGIFEYGIVYNNCGDAIISGKISISSPISVTGKVTPISCGGNDGKIAVTIFGGTPFIDTSGNPYYAITWTGPNGFMQNQTTITGLLAGDYTLTGVDAIGCPLPSVTYTIVPSLPINVSLTSKTSMSCNGTLGCANFNVTGGTGIYTSFLLQYLDPSSQVLKTIIPANNNYFNICGLKAGLYYLTATDSNNCKNVPYLFTIEDYSSLSIKSIALDSQLCNDSPGKIRVEVNSLDTNLTFFYNSLLVPSVSLGNSMYELLINNPTKPSGVVTVKSQNCSDSATVATAILTPDFKFTSYEFENNGYFSVNSSIEFTNLLDMSKIPPDSHIVWSFGDNTPFKVFYYPKDLAANAAGENFKTVFHAYATDGLYEVTLTLFNSSGCSKSITKTITIGSGASMMLPTAFSPNDDGINDLFRPSLIGLKEVSMYIYDEWGNLVYDVSSEVLSLTPSWGWNGIEKVNTEPKNGTYRYYIMAKAIDNKIIEKEGRFLLIK